MWVTVLDITDRWLNDKPLPSDEKIQVIINDFESQVLNRFPTLPDRIVNGKINEAFVISTISGWIIEYLLSEGTPYQQETQSYHNVGSRSITTGSKARTSKTLTYSDLKVLAPKGGRQIGSMNMNTEAGKRPYNHNEYDYTQHYGWSL